MVSGGFGGGFNKEVEGLIKYLNFWMNCIFKHFYFSSSQLRTFSSSPLRTFQVVSWDFQSSFLYIEDPTYKHPQLSEFQVFFYILYRKYIFKIENFGFFFTSPRDWTEDQKNTRRPLKQSRQLTILNGLMRFKYIR